MIHHLFRRRSAHCPTRSLAAVSTPWHQYAASFDVRDYGDPAPFYRTASEWRGPRLSSVSILYDDAVARWDGSALRTASGPLVRVTAVDELGDTARALLCVDRVVPTEEQIAREMGLPVRERRGPPDAIGDILCPTDDCPAP